MALLIAGWLGLRSEMVIAQSVARLQRQAVSLRSERPSPEPDPDLPADKPPRALLADALFIAQQHATAPAPTRRPALIAADETVADVTARRPHSADAWVIRALLRSQLAGEGDASAIDALARSYREAPFLYRAAEWRVGYGARQWGRLDAGSQARLINEALIYGQINGSARLQMFAQIRDTDAYAPVLSAWHRLQLRRALR
ncbi:hypothetical protein SAMIE_1032070 [Sphingobium amiense]|uniref:Uncharacterized protein n=1 Tax=Sphingobium amiense TaxID=135719 RepID=A0A494W8Q0_9SPHN|nr:hypothetical protein [Sphingobium amiense]BBD99706.1 hypothetical protein SAMIE_1032070 [Sphingobium amiense]